MDKRDKSKNDDARRYSFDSKLRARDTFKRDAYGFANLVKDFCNDKLVTSKLLAQHVEHFFIRSIVPAYNIFKDCRPLANSVQNAKQYFLHLSYDCAHKGMDNKSPYEAYLVLCAVTQGIIQGPVFNSDEPGVDFYARHTSGESIAIDVKSCIYGNTIRNQIDCVAHELRQTDNVYVLVNKEPIYSMEHTEEWEVLIEKGAQRLLFVDDPTLTLRTLMSTGVVT